MLSRARVPLLNKLYSYILSTFQTYNPRAHPRVFLYLISYIVIYSSHFSTIQLLGR
nr:MAG TPA: hypothetical protein [Caudoviricetes sp.]